ncbi:MAG: ABC transporter substrate-binding protein [Bacteroidales bacterium]|nr:ABC transporter substrate-binding protein [Bacteroidales bacterium]
MSTSTTTTGGNATVKKIVFGVVAVAVVAVVAFFAIRNQNARDEDIIKIGVILPLTGGGSAVGEQAKRGFLLAENDINATRINNDKKIKLYFEDAPLDATQALNVYKKLRDINHIKYFLSCFSQNSMVIAETIKSSSDNQKTILMTTHLLIEDFPKISPYVFRINVTSKTEAECFYQTLINQLGYKYPALYISNDDFGKDVSSHFIRLCEQNKIPIIKIETFNRGQMEHRLELEKIKAGNPDIVIFIGNDETTAHAIRQARQVGIQCQFVTTCAVANARNWQIAGEGAKNIFYTSLDFDFEPHNNEIQKMYRQKYYEKYGEQPCFLSANAYVSLELLANGIKKSASSTPFDVAQTMSVFKDIETLVGKISFNEIGDAPLDVIMLRLVNNQGELVLSHK